MEIISSHNGMKAIVDLNENEVEWWRKKIGAVKKHYVKPPKELIKEYIDNIKDRPDFSKQVKNTSEFIREVRDETWKVYLASELEFYKVVVKELLQERTTPHEILSSVFTEETLKDFSESENHEELLKKVSDVFGNFAGRIFPYFFELAKSVTNSRRSRAGKAFEQIVHSLMDAYKYPYNDQSTISKKVFKEKGLGKIVDGILPGMESYERNRSKCLVVTMKTTLRERWQEVVEELNRTNVPSIHLLTLDEGITSNVLETMKNHNITLVAYDHVQKKFSAHTNIISFETLFNTEIPHMIEWWDRNKL